MKNPALYSNVSYLDTLLFTKHLAIMIKSGVPLLDAIDTLRGQTKSKAFEKILAGIYEDAKNGQSLVVSLRKYPKVFNQFYISLIEVGESSGTLEQNLEFLSSQLTKEYQLKKKMQGALLYPGLVISATILMGGGITLFVLPKLVDFFASFEATLPLSTQILLWIALVAKQFGIVIAIGCIVLTIAMGIMLQIPKIKYIWHSVMIKIPIFGELLLDQELARFSRNYGILLKSGISSTKGLEITAKTVSNLRMQKDILMVADMLSAGNSIGATMMKEKFPEFPSMVTKMILVGEKTGKLENVLLYLGEYYEEEIENISKNLSTLLEPILLTVIGIIVGFMALAIISPIYELTGSINK